MIKSPNVGPQAALWITLVSAVGLLACNRYLIASGGEYSGSWTTELPAGVSSNPDSFRAHLDPQRGVTHTRKRAGRLCNCTVKVNIGAVGDTRLIQPYHAPSQGVAVAKMENLDPTNIEAYYGLKPSSQAEYYLWVDKRSDSDSARITVIEVPKVGTSSVRAGKQKNLYWCHVHKTADAPDADFAEFKQPCSLTPGESAARVASRGLLWSDLLGILADKIAKAAALIFDTYYARGGWIDCNSGCCT